MMIGDAMTPFDPVLVVFVEVKFEVTVGFCQNKKL